MCGWWVIASGLTSPSIRPFRGAIEGAVEEQLWQAGVCSEALNWILFVFWSRLLVSRWDDCFAVSPVGFFHLFVVVTLTRANANAHANANG